MMKSLGVFGAWVVLACPGFSHRVEEGYIPKDRVLQEEPIAFVPLACNDGLGSAPCRPWSDVMPGSRAGFYGDRVEVPCGSCVIMDESNDEIVFAGGLDIHGKLVFPDGYTATISTTMLAVQGELEITSTKEVDGEPSITFFMIGEEDESFRTGADNVRACGDRCSVGKKAVAVAGGKVNIQGLDDNSPTWLHLYDVVGSNRQAPNRIAVSDSVRGAWGVGAEILITSHTQDWLGQQVRTITRITDHAVNGYVELELDEAIVRPTTLLDSPDFAVEVALLSRNIVFLGGEDSTDYHGGHFIVMRTPSVDQFIQGAEFRKFGQAGTMGRYPVHFHLSRDVRGSKVLKNTVRDSFQRCIIVHGSDNLLIQENVAFDTKGHCFGVEDGVERGNRFIQNLGAKTDTLLRPLTGKKGEESDGKDPATFWITNPSNVFEDNCAAGGEDSGFWFELSARGPLLSLYPGLDPEFEPLTLFRGNKSHSNRQFGIKTYPSGYTPHEMAVLEGLTIYLNRKHGIRFHLSIGMIVQDSLFADNGLGVDIDRADSIEIIDTTFISLSPSFREIMQTQGVDAPCLVQRSNALELHQRRDNNSVSGTTLKNVVFDGYTPDSPCRSAFPMRFDETMAGGLFDMFTQSENAITDRSAPFLDWCGAIRAGAIDGYITDLDGTLAPEDADPNLFNFPAALVSGTPDNYVSMLHFVDQGKCHAVQEGCYTYCQEVCFRSVLYRIDPSISQDYKLRVCRKENDRDCVFLPGVGSSDPLKGRASRNFMAHLPGGEYTAVFVDGDREVFPNFIVEEYEESHECPGSPGPAEVPSLGTPSDTPIYKVNCGGVFGHLGFTGDDGWVPDDEFALTGEKRKAGRRTFLAPGLFMYQTERQAELESDPIMYTFPVPKGDYKVELYFTEVQKSSRGERLMDIYVEDMDRAVEQDFDIFRESGDARKVPLVESYVATVNDNDGLQIKLLGTVDKAKVNAIAISSSGGDRGGGGGSPGEGVASLADGGIQLIDLVPTTECNDLIHNGNAEESDSVPSGWLYFEGDVELARGQGLRGSNAVKGIITKRESYVAQFIDTRCLIEGRAYELSALVKLVDGNGRARQACNPGSELCPDLGYEYGRYGGPSGRFTLAETSAGFAEDGFQRIVARMTVSSEMAEAAAPVFFIRNRIRGTTMLVDNASMRLV